MTPTTGRERWARRTRRPRPRQVRDADFTHPVRRRGRPGLRAGRRERRRADGADRLAGGVSRSPAGLYPSGYRGRPWTIRQFAGFGNAAQTNERYKMILDAGGGGLRSRSTCRR